MYNSLSYSTLQPQYSTVLHNKDCLLLGTGLDLLPILPI